MGSVSRPVIEEEISSPSFWLTGVERKCHLQVLSKELKALGYYKEKGVVEKLFNKFVGQVEMLKSGDVLQVSHSHRKTKNVQWLPGSFQFPEGAV